MRVRRAVGWLLGTLAVFAAASLLLPQSWVLERSLVIDAPADRIWSSLIAPPAWARWSPWQLRSPDLPVRYAGAPSGVGARWSWSKGWQGGGLMQIVRATAPRQMDYVLAVDGMGSAIGQFVLEPASGGTRVTWRIEAHAGFNPFVRWAGLFADRMFGADLEAGLSNLGALARRSGSTTP